VTRSIIVASAVVGLSLLSYQARSETPDKIVWEQSGWQVAAMMNTSGRFIGCYAVRDFLGTTGVRDRFVFANYRDDHWAGLVGGTRIDSIATGQPVSLYVDGKLAHRAIPQLTSVKAGRLGTMTLQAIDALGGGHFLELVSPAGRDRYSLDGSADALSKTVECVNAGIAQEMGGNAVAEIKQFRVPYTVSDGVLNMRQGPSQNAPLIAAVPAGERGLQQVGECRTSDDGLGQAEWCYVQWRGSVGWMSSSGLMQEVVQVPRFAEPRAQPGPAPATSSKSEPTSREPTVFTGSAFYVASGGQLLTNAHVVKDCKAIGIDQPGLTQLEPATVLARDTTNDIALLQTSTTLHTPAPPVFRRHIRLGEDIFVFGYPLTGIVASSGNFTRGSVTALAGVGDDTSRLQLTSPIQPGNSGGPVLDQTGAVVGVVVAKLDALLVAKETGNIPEQINFAIKANTALNFLETNGVTAVEADKSAPAMTAPDIADEAKKFTAHVWCLRE
jgi:S1-C subfamily serine protease